MQRQRPPLYPNEQPPNHGDEDNGTTQTQCLKADGPRTTQGLQDKPEPEDNKAQVSSNADAITLARNRVPRVPD